MNFVKKITTASVGLSAQVVEDAVLNAKKEIAVMRVYGDVSSSESGMTSYGTYSSFSGPGIEAVNLLTGEKYRAKKVILPEVAEVAISAALEKAHENAPDSVVRFALDLTAKPNNSDKGGWKFFYGVKSLLKPSESDNLAKLGESLGGTSAIENKTSKK